MLGKQESDSATSEAPEEKDEQLSLL